MQAKVKELIGKYETLRGDSSRQVSHYKNKCAEYKNKVKQANSAINALGTKFARAELMAAERDEGIEGISGRHRHYASGQENVDLVGEILRNQVNDPL